ncbi:MAG: restriction endonuclease subunit S [Bacteroidales bacterium]|nr:restriction endonuclease subunit S [Bacteroidales bacterium]
MREALLSSLLPQGAETKPRVRLGEFTESWTEYFASDVFQPVSDKGHPELPILSASQELGMIPRSETGIEMSYGTQNVATYKRVLSGHFVIHLRSFQGGFAHSAIEGITSPAYTVMQLKDVASQYDIFWKYVLTSKQFIKCLEAVTYGIRDGKSIKYENFATLKFLVPKKKEQIAIANLLVEYDRLIQFNEQKLDKLRNLKQAMLDKMFV